ncbi:MAG: hypothetical protein ABEI52_06710, partial [Halobacteriaceae archaeon]
MKTNGLLLIVMLATIGGMPLSTATSTTVPTNTTNFSQGERLAGVIQMQEANISGEFNQRTFQVRLRQARTAEAKAAIIANKTETLRNRLQELRNLRRTLIQARRNGSISTGEFVASMASLSARIDSLQEMSNSTVDAARRLPEQVLRSHGINVTAIKAIRQNAHQLKGPQVAAIARTIAGPPENRTTGPPENVTTGPPGNRTTGPPGNANRTVGPPQTTRRGTTHLTKTRPTDSTTGS